MTRARRLYVVTGHLAVSNCSVSDRVSECCGEGAGEPDAGAEGVPAASDDVNQDLRVTLLLVSMTSSILGRGRSGWIVGIGRPANGDVAAAGVREMPRHALDGRRDGVRWRGIVGVRDDLALQVADLVDRGPGLDPGGPYGAQRGGACTEHGAGRWIEDHLQRVPSHRLGDADASCAAIRAFASLAGCDQQWVQVARLFCSPRWGRASLRRLAGSERMPSGARGVGADTERGPTK